VAEDTVTKLAFADRCHFCGGLLVPPEALPYPTRVDADYVCLRCERPYRWVGNPPRLTTILTIAPAADDPREQ
jgi:hypothetical protein